MTSIRTALTICGLTLGAAGWAVAGSQIDLSKLPAAADKAGVTYEKDIKPLFEASCMRCHSGQRAKAGLHLDSLEGTLKGSKDGKVVIPGKSTSSDLLIAVSQLDPEKAMPPKPRKGGPGGPPPGDGGFGGPPPGDGGAGGPPPGDAAAGGPAGGGRRGAPPKPLTTEQVALVRAWIDQGAK